MLRKTKSTPAFSANQSINQKRMEKEANKLLDYIENMEIEESLSNINPSLRVYTEISLPTEYEHERRRLLAEYNQIVENLIWFGFLKPEN